MVDHLAGTPYSLPDGASGGALAEISERELKIRKRLSAVETKIRDEVDVRTDIRRYQRAREIFESNRIEGLGPDLRRTDVLLQEHLNDDVRSSMFQNLLTTSLLSDPQLVAVLGMHAAKVLADEVMQNYLHRPLSAVDLRSLHAQICVGEWHSGAFKKWGNEIEGSSHRTPLPIDTGAHISNLLDWLSSPGDLPPSLISGVAHGWLTHIHPFTDGNGRLARLLMNLLLTSSGLPPVIIRHDTDRSAYIDALAESDRGGDILPLIDMFLDAQMRFTRELNRRDLLRQIFRDELAKRSSTEFAAWSALLDDFVTELSVALVARRRSAARLDPVSPEAFDQLLNADPSGNSWLVRISGGRRDILLWAGYSSLSMGISAESRIRWPSIWISVRSDSWSLHPWRQVSGNEAGGLKEITLIPGLSSNRVYTRDSVSGRVRVGTVRDAADEIAARLSLDPVEWRE